VVRPHNSRNLFCPGPLGFLQPSLQTFEQNSVGRLDLPVCLGCSTDVNSCFIPSSVHILPNVWLANWVPLSDTKHFGTPKRHTMFFHTKCWTLWGVICATGLVSIHFVKYSMATTRYFICRTAKGNGPIMLIPQV